MHTEQRHIIVKIIANFLQGENLFAWVKRYAQAHDSIFAYWDEFAFTINDMIEADAVLVFNTPSKPINTFCSTGKSLAFMMEPGIAARHPWMYKGLEKFTKVYSPLVKSANTVPSHGFSGWYPDYDWKDVKEMPVPEKKHDISCISSGLSFLKGHRLRNHFISYLQNEMSSISFYGRNTNPLKDKMEGLLPYRYSIAIENTAAPHYFTEKINDCFLAYAVPVYFGCTNISSYFPSKAVIEIDITRPEYALQQIKETISTSDWHERFSALQEARELVLHKYQPLAGAASIFRDMPCQDEKKVKLYPVTATLLDRCKRVLQEMSY